MPLLVWTRCTLWKSLHLQYDKQTVQCSNCLQGHASIWYVRVTCTTLHIHEYADIQWPKNGYRHRSNSALRHGTLKLVYDIIFSYRGGSYTAPTIVYFNGTFPWVCCVWHALREAQLDNDVLYIKHVLVNSLHLIIYFNTSLGLSLAAPNVFERHSSSIRRIEHFTISHALWWLRTEHYPKWEQTFLQHVEPNGCADQVSNFQGGNVEWTFVRDLDILVRSEYWSYS